MVYLHGSDERQQAIADELTKQRPYPAPNKSARPDVSDLRGPVLSANDLGQQDRVISFTTIVDLTFMPVRSARRASRQGMPRRPVAAGQSPDRDRSRLGVGPTSMAKPANGPRSLSTGRLIWRRTALSWPKWVLRRRAYQCTNWNTHRSSRPCRRSPCTIVHHSYRKPDRRIGIPINPMGICWAWCAEHLFSALGFLQVGDAETSMPVVPATASACLNARPAAGHGRLRNVARFCAPARYRRIGTPRERACWTVCSERFCGPGCYVPFVDMIRCRR